MLILQVYTDEWKSVELYDHEPVNLTYKFTEVTEINNPASNYSQTFRVPMTKANQDVFGAFGLGHIPDLNYKQKIPARILRGGVTLMDGFAQIKTFYIQRGKFQDLELVLFGELANLSRSVGDAMLQDTNLAAYNFALNSTNVTDGLGTSGLSGGNIRLGVVDRGWGWTDDLNPFNSNLFFTPSDLTPFVRVSFLLERIFSDAGLTFESDFFDAQTDLYLMALSASELYQTLIYQTQEMYIGKTASQSISATTWTAVTFSDSTPYYDDGSDWVTDTYTAPVTGWYKFKAYLRTDASTYQFRINGSTSGVAYTATFTNDFANQFKVVEIDVHLAATETVQFEVYGSAGFNVYGHATELNATRIYLLEYYQTEGGTIDLAKNLPELKQIDFISGLQKSFNLVFIADKNRPTHFYIEPWSDYMSAGSKKDWTNKLNTENDITIRPTTDLQNRRYVWQNAESEDVINAQAKSATGEVYGAKIIEDGSNDFASGQFSVSSPFAPFIVSPVGETDVSAFKLLKQDSGVTQKIEKPKPFLAFYNGEIGADLYIDIAGSQTTKPLPYFSNAEKYTTTLDDLSLSFGHPVPYHFVLTTPLNGLYYKWWSAWANELFSPDARILEAFFYLTSIDIAQMEWSDKIYLFNQYWRILEVQNFDATQDGLTRVKLVKILGAIADCEQLPSTGSRGIIQGTPVSLTKKCCERYGFVYDLTSKKCYQPTSLQV